MKPFIEFVVQDDHNHSSYEAQLGCYSRYVNNCAKDGDADAVSFKIFDLRAEYDEAIIKRLALNGYSSAARIIDNNFENVTQDVIGDEIETAGPASKKVKLGSGAAVRNGRSKSSKTASGSHPGLTISTAGQHRLRYEDFDETKFMKLKSGRVVEKVLMDEICQTTRPSSSILLTRSFVIDFNCHYTKSLFTQQEWQELSAFNNFVLPNLPDTLVRYIVQLGKAWPCIPHRQRRIQHMQTRLRE
ncbi:MAG: hypothetical protein J3Q66DRAFT_361727 [Benniella sp.]|nr:MAG: hypothetical protein J3Q66DRAFT_361727 [Benniella sp.]